MSFLSVLGKVGKGLLGFGGGIDYGKLGEVVSGGAKGSADQRMAENNQALQRSQIEALLARDAAGFGQTGARDAFSAGMQGQQFNANEQQRGMRNTLLAQLLGPNGVQDVSISGGSGRIPRSTVSGGLRPSALGNRDALMQALSQPTMQAPTYTPGQPYVPPALPATAEPGKLEKILGGIGLGGSILGSLGLFGKPPENEPVSGVLNPRLIRNVSF